MGLSNFDVVGATKTWACITTNKETKYKGKYQVWLNEYGRHLPVRTIQARQAFELKNVHSSAPHAVSTSAGTAPSDTYQRW